MSTRTRDAKTTDRATAQRARHAMLAAVVIVTLAAMPATVASAGDQSTELPLFPLPSVLDFTRGDAQMRRFRDHGFRMPAVTYCALEGLNTYFQDTAAMEAAGFTEYPQFLKAVFDTTINRWNPVKVSCRIDASNPCSEYMFLDDTAVATSRA